jgi:hypothetical protein
MTEESETREGSRWLLEPPSPGEAQLHLALGEAVPVTAEINAAIEALLQALQVAEVEGFRSCTPKCKGLSNCGGEGQPGFGCMSHGNCTFLNASPCARYVSCQIAPTLGGLL